VKKEITWHNSKNRKVGQQTSKCFSSRQTGVEPCERLTSFDAGSVGALQQLNCVKQHISTSVSSTLTV